jgi:four helix bundle protein
MKSDNAIRVKSYDFAVRIIKMCRGLSEKKKEFVLSKQILRCGTSIGANIEEAIGTQSRADFYSKLSVAYKEAREVCYWLRLLKDTNYLTSRQFESIHSDTEELCRIIGSIQKTLKNS